VRTIAPSCGRGRLWRDPPAAGGGARGSRGDGCGGVGYYTWNGDADFAIVIRTIVLAGDRMFVQAGAGIVADSDTTYEYLETERKMAAMMKVIER